MEWLSIYSAYKSVVQIFVSHPDNFSLVNIFKRPTILFVNFLSSKIFGPSFEGIYLETEFSMQM